MERDYYNSASDEMVWAEAIRNGNRLAYGQLYNRYYGPLCDFAWRFCKGNHELVEDVVQEVLFRVWERRHNWMPTVTVKSYLYRSVHNMALTRLRKTRYEILCSDCYFDDSPTDAFTPFESMHNTQLMQAIILAVNRLPERRRQILVLRLMHEHSYQEIAELLGISFNTVDTQLRRAQKFLRTQLQEYR
jgi:RNA polymerase sigma-70 factor (family 1)